VCLGERGLATDPETSLLNSFFSMLNKEMLAEEFSYAGPFYHHHLTEELRQTDYQRDKQERYSLYCLVLILGVLKLLGYTSTIGQIWS
jgi:hypothetical protein